MNSEPIVIKDPPKSWWAGDPRVEKFMPKVSEAIQRHLPWPSAEYTDIYNRAYEAVYAAIQEYDQNKAQTETMTHAADMATNPTPKNRKRHKSKR